MVFILDIYEKEEREQIAEDRQKLKNNSPLIRSIATACCLTSHVCALHLFCILAILPQLSIIKLCNFKSKIFI